MVRIRSAMGRRSAAALATLAAVVVAGGASAGTLTVAATGQFPAQGNLDCNGHSPLQKPLKAGGYYCAEVRTGGESDSKNLEDNGYYIGHDEPLIQFYSTQPGSGTNITWTEVLPHDPAASPTVKDPGSDVSHFFQLSPALWFSMALCDPNSYPQLPCTPDSDANAPSGRYPGAGNAFLEVQYYPPGFAPFADAISCDNSHWCAALTIDSLECTDSFNCNNNCVEPINFAWIATTGVPSGPPSPQRSNLNTVTPNQYTLLMNPGDSIRTQIFDNRKAGALEVRVSDLSTGKTGFMLASASNGFENTSITDCSGTPYSFRPEYSSAALQNQGSWANANIATAYEIGHFTPCTSLSQRSSVSFGKVRDVAYSECSGPYENSVPAEGGNAEPGGDYPCFWKGDTHGTLNAAPDLATGCLVEDLDYDGSQYWREWPDSVTPDRYPSPLLQLQPATVNGARYQQMQFITDNPASNPRCSAATLTTQCTIPPPQAPGHFYPYWTLAQSGGGCVWEFGQMPNGQSYGGDKQYGKPTIYPGNFIQDAGPVMSNPDC